MEPAQPDDSAHWKLGFIYYNPDDSKILVRKRYGIGWTFNFAHWVSYLFIVAIIFIIWAIRYYMR